MPVYAYVAKMPDGHEVRDLVTAGSRFAALTDLRDRGCTVLELSEDGLAGNAPAESPAPARRRTFATMPAPARVSIGERAMFCRQLAVSVGAGVPLRDALDSITEDLENPGFRKILVSVVQGLHDGKTFSEALSPHRSVFSTLFVALVKTAEESGSMPQTLENIASSLEKTERLVRKVRTATAYPLFVALFFCVIVAVMTLFVLPQFQENFASFGSKLPLITRAVFAVNKVLVRFFPLIMGGGFLAAAALVLYGRTRGGARRIDGWKLNMPLFGSWARKFALARFCRNLSIMIRGGVPITTAIEIASATCGNMVMELALLTVRDKIVNGSSFNAALAGAQGFPKLLLRMVNVGESSGRLPEVLEKVSDVYEEQVEGEIVTATMLFEPIMITAFGAIILIIVLAIYVPVFTVSSQMR